jgi:uncharacterized membrane protein
VGSGAFGGAFWGLLIGLLFAVPWMGLAIGAVAGAAIGGLTDHGVDDKFINPASGRRPAIANPAKHKRKGGKSCH